MAQTNYDAYLSVKHGLDDAAADDDHPLTHQDARLIKDLCDAFDPKKLPNKDQKAKINNFDRGDRADRKSSTLKAWAQAMKMVATTLDCSLADATIDGLNRCFEDRLGDRSIHTIQQRQRTCRVFYRYHDQLGVDDQLLPVFNVEADGGDDDDRGFDPDQMLSREEIEAMKDAATSSRDRAVFMALLYTGMRVTALTNLQWKHLDLEAGEYRFPSVSDGLKGLHKPDRRRPLLYAGPALKQWRQDHPDSDDPDAYVFTALPGQYQYDATSPVSSTTIRRVMEGLALTSSHPNLVPLDPQYRHRQSPAEALGVETDDRNEADVKPTNPHMMRHNFVTLCKEDYKLHDSTVKFYIGHSPDSNVMETTYSHLSDDHHINEGKEKFGLKEPDEPSETLTPDECEACGAQLSPGAKACDRCGTLITPDAKAAVDMVDEALTDDALDADKEADKEAVKTAVSFIKSNPDLAAENPELVRELLDG